MCMVYFIGGSGTLPRVDWDEEQRAFHIGDLSDSESAALDHFPDAQVVLYVGSHLQCGCGFRCESLGAEPEEAPDKQRSHEQLAAYLSALSPDTAPVHIYCCWSGDEGEPTEHLRTVSPNRLRDPDFEFRERELLTISL